MDTEYTQAVAAEFRAAQGREQVSIADIAALAGMNPKTVSRSLNGHRAISVEELIKLSDALNLDAGDVVAAVVQSTPLAKSA